MVPSDWNICQTLSMISVAYGLGGRILGLGVCILPPAIFKNVFDVPVCKFSIISSLFDSNKLYTLSTRKSKVCEQNASYLAKHSELGSKKLNKICLKYIQKALK